MRQHNVNNLVASLVEAWLRQLGDEVGVRAESLANVRILLKRGLEAVRAVLVEGRNNRLGLIVTSRSGVSRILENGVILRRLRVRDRFDLAGATVRRADNAVGRLKLTRMASQIVLTPLKSALQSHRLHVSLQTLSGLFLDVSIIELIYLRTVATGICFDA